MGFFISRRSVQRLFRTVSQSADSAMTVRSFLANNGMLVIRYPPHVNRLLFPFPEAKSASREKNISGHPRHQEE
jgi:hypothetical protein